MDITSLIILLSIVGLFGYCGGTPHGFHKLLESIGLEPGNKDKKF